MGGRIGSLTAARVTALGRTTERRYYGDGGGLYLQVTPGGASWVFRYRTSAERDSKGRPKLKEMGIGPLHTIGLADARERAREQRRLRLDGKDPLVERRAAQQAQASVASFRQCGEAYIASHQAGWRNGKHAVQWVQSLRDYVYPMFGDLPVQSIDVGLVLKAIEPIWATKAETASRVRGRIESVLDWATARGYRQGENPARWRGHLENLLPKKSKVARIEHYAALPYSDIGAFIADLRKLGGAGAHALEFAILTASRTNEVLGARWEEIDVVNRLWTISADRMKAGREHRVPLSDAAMAIVKKQEALRSSEYVFPGRRQGKPLSAMTMAMALRGLKRTDVTVHGFRSTFSDWCAERTAFPAEVREMALAHAVGDRVEAAYRRGDLFQKRRQLAEAWGRFCATPMIPGKIVPIGQTAGHLAVSRQ